jgi:Flp pilus assembly protein TadB
MFILLEILTLTSVWAFIASILLYIYSKEKPIEKLKYINEDFILKDKIIRNNDRFIKQLSSLLPQFCLKLKTRNKLELELLKAGIPITVDELLIIKLLSSTIFAFIFYALSGNYIVLLIIYTIVWNLPKIIILNKKKERLKQFNYQLNEGIMIISNSLKAGYSFLQAISVVIEETKDPFSKEFKSLLKEMSLGISEEIAIKNLQARMDSEDLKLITNAILIQKDIGGNLSEILESIGETIRERQKIQNELRTLTAQGKLSGIIVMLIPIFLGFTIYLFNKEYIILLFTNPIGIAMLSAALFNQIIGFIIIKKIIKIDM